MIEFHSQSRSTNIFPFPALVIGRERLNAVCANKVASSRLPRLRRYYCFVHSHFFLCLSKYESFIIPYPLLSRVKFYSRQVEFFFEQKIERVFNIATHTPEISTPTHSSTFLPTYPTTSTFVRSTLWARLILMRANFYIYF